MRGERAMSASTYALVSVPASIAVLTLLLRHGPSALLTIVAGVVAVLVPGKRSDRALAVLRLLQVNSSDTQERRRCGSRPANSHDDTTR